MSTVQLTTPQPPTGLVVDGVAWGPLTPAPAPVPPPAPAPTPPPASAPYPAGWNRAGITWTELKGSLHETMRDQVWRYISIDDFANGDPDVDPAPTYAGYTLNTFRLRGAEGPRANGGLIVLRDGYIEVKARPGAGDHTDGVQAVRGKGATITSTKILAGGDGATCMFFADASTGPVTLDGDYFGALPGAPRPGFLIRINGDGASSVAVANTVIERDVAEFASIAIDPAVPITRWLNVVDQFGKPWPQPH